METGKVSADSKNTGFSDSSKIKMDAIFADLHIYYFPEDQTIPV